MVLSPNPYFWSAIQWNDFRHESFLINDDLVALRLIRTIENGLSHLALLRFLSNPVKANSSNNQNQQQKEADIPKDGASLIT